MFGKRRLLLLLLSYTVSVFADTQTLNKYVPIMMGDGITIFVLQGAPEARKSKVILFDDGEHGREPWITDGTPEGTHLVKDINEDGYASLGVEYGVYIGNTYYFSADDGVHGQELWKSDGTASGTVMVKDIIVGQVGAAPEKLTVMDNSLYFFTTNNSSGKTLWKSNGTANGTVQVKTIEVGAYMHIQHFIADNHELYFQIASYNLDGDAVSFNVSQMWKSDGTSNGTSTLYEWDTFADYYNNIVALNNVVYFGKDDSLWRTDGTLEGTYDLNIDMFTLQVKNVNNQIYLMRLLLEGGKYRGHLLTLEKNNEGKETVKEIKNFDGSTGLYVFDNVMYIFEREYQDTIITDTMWRYYGRSSEPEIWKTFQYETEIVNGCTTFYMAHMLINDNFYVHRINYIYEDVSLSVTGLYLNGNEHYLYGTNYTINNTHNHINQFELNDELIFILRDSDRDVLYRSNTETTVKLVP